MIDDKDSNWIPNATQQRLESEASKLIDVRNACLAARANAHAAAVDTDSSDDYSKYISARDRCIRLAESISDGFYRDTAFHLIYDLCKRAGDEANAQIIFDRITSDMIRGKIIDGRPALFD
jgi:hypothetical protein